MKNNSVTLLLAVSVSLALLFCGLWIHEKKDQSKIERLCQNSATQSFENFREYKDGKPDEYYWYGVSDFKAFMNTWIILKGSSSFDYIECNKAYANMILKTEKVKEYMDELLIAMGCIAEDYTDANGYIKLAELNNLIEHG